MADGKSIVEKALGTDAAPSNASSQEARLIQTSALEQRFNPALLCKIYENSQYLRPNIDAYCTNIDGFGHKFEPVINIDSEDGKEQVKTAMILERQWEQEALVEAGELDAEGDLPDVPDPTDAEVDEKVSTLEKQLLIERWKLKACFDNMVDESSFVTLRKHLRQDKEITGNAYMEIRRGKLDNRPAKASYVPACMIVPLPLEQTRVEISTRIPTSPLTFEDVTVERRFRRFKQTSGEDSSCVYYKEFGDPRIMSSMTGGFFEDDKEWKRHVESEEGKGDVRATELIHFKVHSPMTAVGVPRWVGCTPEILGSRESAEVNLSYFNNKTIPPLVVTVSGGKLAAGASEKMRDFISNELKGRENFDKILILEADMSPSPMQESANSPKIEIKPLAQREDGLFLDYDRSNSRKVKDCFRNPSFLLGDTDNTNFATAQVARLFAEEQVYQPEREEFDHVMNQTIMAALGVKYHRYHSKSPSMKNPELLTDMVDKLTRANVLTPAEARELSEEIFNKEFGNLGEDWTLRPVPLTLAGITEDSPAGMTEEEASAAKDDAALAKAMYFTHQMKNAHEKLSSVSIDHAYETEVIKLSKERFDELVEYT